MKRLLTLTSNDFYTGISAGAHVDRGGLFSDADGINTFVDTQQGTANAGLLQTCSTPSDITGSMAGIPTDYDISGSEVWFVTDDGDICSIDLTNDTVTVEIDATAHSFSGTTYNGAGSGCAFFTAQQGAVEYLYYFSLIDSTYYLSRVSNEGTPTDDADYDSLGASAPTVRPIVRFKDRLYYGNLDKSGTRDAYCIGSVYSNASATVVNDKNVLDLQPDMQVTALADDGTYLVIAASENTALDSTVYNRTSVYFWDTNSSSWTREFEIPEPYIVAMKRVGDRIYAVGARGLWVFSFQSRPYKIRSLGANDTPGSKYHGAISSVNNAVLFGSGGDTAVWSYGEMVQGIGVKDVLHKPFASAQDYATSMVISNARVGKVYVGNSNEKLYSYALDSGGATSLSAKTVYIPLSSKTHVKEVEVILGEPLASGDSLNIDLQGDEDNAATDWGTVSFAAHGAVQRVNLRGSKRNIENLRLVLNFNGGNVKIKRINVYGSDEPVAKR